MDLSLFTIILKLELIFLLYKHTISMYVSILKQKYNFRNL